MTLLVPEIIAIFSAMGWAVDSILVRFGLHKSNIFAAMLMSYAVSITCVWTYLIATTSLEFLASPAMIYYLISGCMQPLFARALFYQGITRIGVARAGPLRGSEPLFAAAIAVLVLNEEPGLKCTSARSNRRQSVVDLGSAAARRQMARHRCAPADQRRVDLGDLADAA